MPEHQNIEYKASWHDDYLKWIVGYANAQGGIIYIGKDNDGKVTGIDDYKRLMDELPNKIRDLLGMITEVNLHEEKGLYYIEIITPPYTVPISLRGRYYYRSGSTKQELTGNSLNEFLLKKTGKTWDDIIEANATINDIDEKSVAQYLKTAERSGRLPDTEGLSLTDLLEKLRLTENGKIKRAAIILFGKDPGRFYPNILVKMGRFGSNDFDLKFQETEEGNIIQLLREVPNQLNRKFFIKPVSFEGLLRIEKGEYPVAALREMLLNALVHRSYMGSMVQIRIYDNRFSIWNEGILLEGLTIASLRRQHPSRQRNPIIAEVCFKGGYIDSWGSGTLKIIDSCHEAGLPEPEIKEQDGGMQITLFKDVHMADILGNYSLNERQKEALLFWEKEGEITSGKYKEKFNVTDRTVLRDLNELVDLGLLIKIGEKKTTKYIFIK